MSFSLMFAAFIISCMVIIVCFLKKQMKFAYAAFLSVGLYVVVISATLTFLDRVIGEHYSAMLKLDVVLSYLLGISTIVYGIVAVVNIVATVIFSVFVVKKIAEYLSKKKFDEICATKYIFRLPLTADFLRLKYFKLYCRWIN